ncbi:tyrosine-type recombinase/integrase [Oceanicaulis sp.]|uniref:tyrosine-type recombinase/integrase n=1 Tax=Oceanicaulis sp. TaxID=1924941 RepID=UPI003BA87D2B
MEAGFENDLGSMTMKNKQRLTNTSVAKLATTRKDYKVWDSECPGLYVRVTPAGSKSFAFWYRNENGDQRSKALGKASMMKVEEARRKARSLRVRVDDGGDPSRERSDRIHAPRMMDLWDVYLDQHATTKNKPRTVEENRRLWRLHLEPRFAREMVASVSVAQVRDMMAKMKETPGAANRSFSLLSKMFNLAIENEWRAGNPCKPVKKYPENAVERYLTHDETSRLLRALKEDDNRCAATILEFLLLTGARKGEVLEMRRSDLEGLGTGQAVWTVPAGHQKGERQQRTALRRQLSPEAEAVIVKWLEDCDTPSLRWVFPSQKTPTQPTSCIKSAWNRIRKRAGLEDVRIHDLRHSFASFAVNAGAPLYAVGAALGHKELRTTQRYAHLTEDTVRDVASKVSGAVDTAR